MGLTLLLLLALAQEPASITRQVFEVAGKVDSVNRCRSNDHRQGDGRAPGAHVLGSDLAIFDTLNKGDELIVRYFDSYVVEVTPGKRMVPPQFMTGAELDELKRMTAACCSGRGWSCRSMP